MGLISIKLTYIHIILIFSEDLFQIFEILIASLFAVDYMWGFFQAANKKKFIFNILNLLDLFTILPVFVSFIGVSLNYEFFQ